MIVQLITDRLDEHFVSLANYVFSVLSDSIVHSNIVSSMSTVSECLLRIINMSNKKWANHYAVSPLK